MDCRLKLTCLLQVRVAEGSTQTDIDVSGFCMEAQTAIDMIFEGSEVPGGNPFKQALGLIGQSYSVPKESIESLTFTTAITFLLETLTQSFGKKQSRTDEADTGAIEATRPDELETVSPLEKAEKRAKAEEAVKKLPKLKHNSPWHTKLQHYLTIADALRPKSMRGKHANDVLLVDDLEFIGNAKSPFHYAIIDESMDKAGKTGLRSKHWKSVRLRQFAVTDAAANHLSFTKNCPTKDPFASIYKQFTNGSHVVWSESKKKHRTVKMDEADEVTFTLGNHAYKQGCTVFNSKDGRATITAFASNLRDFVLSPTKLRVFRPPSSNKNYVLRPPSFRKVITNVDADTRWIIHVPLELVEDSNPEHMSASRDSRKKKKSAKKGHGSDDCEKLTDQQNGSSEMVDESLDVDDPMDVDTTPVEDGLDLRVSLLKGLDELVNLSTPADQQQALRALLEQCKNKVIGEPIAELLEAQVDKCKQLNDRKNGAQDWIDVRTLRKMAEEYFNAVRWSFDESRDPEDLRHVPPNRHILVVRSGITPDKHRLKGLSWISCDPGSRVFICAYNPANGDIFLIGSEMGAWVGTMLRLVKDLKSAMDKGINEEEVVKKAFQAYLDERLQLIQLRKNPQSTIEELADLSVQIDHLESVWQQTRANVSRFPKFVNQAVKIQTLRESLKTRVKAFHLVAASFLDKFNIVILPGFDFKRMTRQGGTGPQGEAKTVLTTLSHGDFFNLLSRRMASVGRRPLVPSEAFSSQACVFCGNLRKVGRTFIYKCSKCNN
ncbi:hypothetical protein BDZ88DRAFT_454136 [Geranomyces variabilis]|nr:hypothetical protein BDZ88DRAFT_454136 [Geranomyces variabilis]KAJ3135830.1 hypothetical protein HDU90_003569 [Geranomyces variabilis]